MRSLVKIDWPSPGFEQQRIPLKAATVRRQIIWDTLRLKIREFWLVGFVMLNTEFGSTYSFDDIAGWLTEARFTNPRQLPGPGPSPLILATRG